MPQIRAPEFSAKLPWLNVDRPLSLKELKGRVVLLDFWTYCCINCLHILPDLKYLEEKYPTLVVIGVHSAKFDHEKDVESIRQAIARYNIQHPVLVDSGLHTWRNYVVRAWPTFVVIDRNGYIAGTFAGEGKRELLDELIGNLIEENTSDLPPIRKQQEPILSPIAFPGKVLADAESNQLFIADSGHHRIVVTTLNGEVKHTIGVGVAGWKDGDFETAQFAAPQGMAIDPNHRFLYVADTDNHLIRRIDFQKQIVETIAGTGQQSRNIRPHSGYGLETALNSPWDLALVADSLLIAMAGSHEIWELRLSTGMIRTYAGTGAEFRVDGAIEEAAFAQPSGLAIAGRELFIADSEISSIRAIELGSDPQVRTVCGSGDLFGFGNRDGQGEEVRLQHCMGIAYGLGALWIADTYNHKIKRVDPQTGECTTILGGFAEPSGLSIAGSTLFVADTNHHQIQRIDLDSLTVSAIEFPGLCAPGLCFPS
ncbi:redoxin domain-containing protein [Microcoleus sp. FACHB-1515]|uniref:thioredoxin-like domain-containing protein n=1 Tax=Cyanophyceae TaxID=3028117 RepID=UPI00168634E5|nr:thioredoxin-like domain-containing protein [Microcoleus sp. FACHB-1515]MBD2090252.1 redoxin domain-containing protein [Microcoleus sp. FACHB-1515]